MKCLPRRRHGKSKIKNQKAKIKNGRHRQSAPPTGCGALMEKERGAPGLPEAIFDFCPLIFDF
jgi:hypothetical protein